MTVRMMSALLALGLACCGCANTQLRVSTLRQARTITDLQYRQVLDNLAMFELDRNAIPCLVSLKTGSTQVGDTGGAALGFLFADATPTAIMPSFSASRSIVDQWGTVPVTDDNTLRLLRMAYQSATGIPRLLNDEEANDMGHDLSQQIGTNADISIDADTLRAFVTISKDQLQQLSDVEDLPPPEEDSQTPGVRPTEEKLQTTEKTKQQIAAAQLLKLYSAVDDALTNTLDPEFLETDKSHPPLFELKGKVSTGLAKETARRINDVQATLMQIPSGWFVVGCKRDIPCDACYVGHFKSCHRECYVWVRPQGRAALAEFTLAVLKLSTVFQDTQIVTVPSGIQFSPALTRPAR